MSIIQKTAAEQLALLRSGEITSVELIKLLNLCKAVQKLVERLTRRIENKLVIEQAAVIAALKADSYNEPQLGKEIAKYLELRLNTIESNLWNVNYIDMCSSDWLIFFENGNDKPTDQV